jgi:type IV pilus assembly protein PilV
MKTSSRIGQCGAIHAGQAGIVLLEGLIAILIFSLGILTIIGIQAASVRGVGDAQLRTRAVLLADQLVGQMWVSGGSIGELKTAFESPDGAAYVEWLPQVVAGLPGVAADSDTAPTVTVANTSDETAGQVIVTLFWRTPSMPADERHRYIVISQISRNE